MHITYIQWELVSILKFQVSQLSVFEFLAFNQAFELYALFFFFFFVHTLLPLSKHSNDQNICQDEKTDSLKL